MSQVYGYRLVKQKWRHSAYDGEGARLYGGRWNSKGNACVYLASSESLAMLEVMVHIEDYALLEKYTLIEVSLNGDDLLQLPKDEWPTNWRVDPAPSSTAEIGDSWLESQSSLALVIPSVVVPRETNYLLDPRHPNFAARVARATEVDFAPDKRL